MSLNDFRKRSTLAAASAALAVGLTVSLAPTAQAVEDGWGGIATGPNGAWQLWWGKPQGAANYFGQWARCGVDRKKVLVFKECGALAYNGGAFSPPEGSTLQEAEGEALTDLPGGWIVASRCNIAGEGNINWKDNPSGN
jgi:hypothetical protein